MPSDSSRKFALADAMVLVAATAVGLALIQATQPDLLSLNSKFFNQPRPGMRTAFMMQFALSLALPLLAAWTPAILMLRLRRPRPRLGRVARQPGAVACAAATAAMTIVALWILALWAAGVGGRMLYPSALFVTYAQLVGFAVVGGWASLALGGRWRQEPSWIDRVGRIAGAAWIAATAVDWSRTLFLF